MNQRPDRHCFRASCKRVATRWWPLHPWYVSMVRFAAYCADHEPPPDEVYRTSCGPLSLDEVEAWEVLQL